MIGILTWGSRMPSGFPIHTPQNAGNMVHARAPFEMFPNSVGLDFGFKEEGYASFVDFVNARCSALVVPLANTIRMDSEHDKRARAHCKALSKYEVPIIIFGLGAQAATTDLSAFELGPGMREFVSFLSERASAISVRGEFTYRIFEKYAATRNVYITGCPSFFSHPDAFEKLRTRLRSPTSFSRAAFAGSLYHKPASKDQLYRAIMQDMYLLEPVNPALHQFYLDCANDTEPLQPSYFLKELVKRDGWSIDRLKLYMIRRYRLFRDMNSWLEFNRETIEGSVGTRFHVNMATLLSGLPAVWIVHDSRTQELCDRLSLPYLLETNLGDKSYRGMLSNADYEPMFASLPGLFDDFNGFLRAAGLPERPVPSVSQS